MAAGDSFRPPEWTLSPRRISRPSDPHFIKALYSEKGSLMAGKIRLNDAIIPSFSLRGHEFSSAFSCRILRTCARRRARNPTFLAKNLLFTDASGAGGILRWREGPRLFIPSFRRSS